MSSGTLVSMLSENFVYLGAIFGLAGSVSYIIATLRGQTRPNRVTWALWAIAPMLAFGGALDEGVGSQALMSLMSGLCPALILVASLVNRGAYWKLGRLDIVCGLLSLCGLALWLATREGTVAIAAAIAADGLAAVPTVVKAYRHPETEHARTFWIAALNPALVLMTIDHWTFAAWGFPVYILFVCLLIGGLVSSRIGAVTPGRPSPLLEVS